MINPPVGRAQAKCDRVIAIIAMHKRQRDDVITHSAFVLDAAPHPELSKESVRRLRVLLANDTVAETAVAGFESSVHAAARMEWLAELSMRSVEDFDRSSIRIVELQNLKHAALLRLALRAEAELYSSGSELVLHLGKFLRNDDPETEIEHIVAIVAMDYQAMVPIVGSQIESV